LNKPGSPGDSRRALPSLDALLRRHEVASWFEKWGRAPVRDALRSVLAEQRTNPAKAGAEITLDEILACAGHLLEGDRPMLRSVLNGTGVILHTNLGRAPMAAEAGEAALRVAVTYSALEYDLAAGSRGDRYRHCVGLLCRMTGSEDALVVNNNAAAVALAINELARGREVIVSRGELVEIGGGFRVPEVVERAGGFLVGVGTTNRTRIDDYRRAITPSTGLLLKVHPSNYEIRGFTEETTLEELVGLGRGSGLPVMHDLGSGYLPPAGYPIALPEPPTALSVSAGADLITWSGDKLFGGPQAGLVHGSSAVVGRLCNNPLLRAFRVDKMTLAALEATLRLYADPARAMERIPVLRMLSEDRESVEMRARETLELLQGEAAARVAVVPLSSVVGGGSAPGFEVPSSGWALRGEPDARDADLRSLDPALIGRVDGGRLCVDFRTLLPGEEALAAEAVNRVLGVASRAS
jgi:L-seryl-tRNA(Ser) seleniumtransferase